MLIGKILLMGALSVLLLFGIQYLADSVVIGPAVVIDGGTLKVGEKRVKLAGLDALARDQTCLFAKTRWPCGQHAAAALTRAITNRTVTCRPSGPETDGQREAVCFVGTDEDLGRRLVAEGWAMARPGAHVNYQAEEAAARKRLAGVWSSFFDVPRKPPAKDLPL